MPVTYGGFRTRDVPPRIVPGKSIPKPSEPKSEPATPPDDKPAATVPSPPGR